MDYRKLPYFLLPFFSIGALTAKAPPNVNSIISGNAGEMARALNCLTPPTGSDLSNILLFLGNTSNYDVLKEDLEQMEQASLNGLAVSNENVLIRMRTLFSRRSEELSDLCASCKEPTRSLLVKSRRNVKPTATDATNTWVAPLLDLAHQDGNDHDELGFQANTGGIAGGADHRFANRGFIGAGVGFTYTNIDFNHSGGNGKIRNYYAGVYGGWTNKCHYVEGALLGAFSQYKGTRGIELTNNATSFRREANHSPSGGELIAHIGYEKRYAKWQTEFAPVLGLDYAWVRQNGYTEESAGGLALNVNGKNSTMWRTEIGGRTSKCFAIGGGVLTPNLKVSWIYEARDRGTRTRGAFECGNSCCSFGVNGLNPSRNLIAPSAQVAYLLANSDYSFTALYAGEFGDDWRDNFLSLTMTFKY